MRALPAYVRNSNPLKNPNNAGRRVEIFERRFRCGNRAKTDPRPVYPPKVPCTFLLETVQFSLCTGPPSLAI